MPSSLRPLRQSAAEIAACAFCEIFPDALLVEGVISDIGFHYDFVLNQNLDQSVLPIIEERMYALIQQSPSIDVLEMMRENAVNYFSHKGQEIKAQLVAIFPSNIVKVFKMGDFIDLCSELPQKNIKEIKAFKLQKISPETVFLPEIGKLEVLRLSGTCFSDSYALKQFLKRCEKAKKRDHRLLGQELGLFNQENGSEGCIWTPKGAFLIHLLQEFWTKQQAPLPQPLHSSSFIPARLVELSSGKDQRKKLLTLEKNFPATPFAGQDYLIGSDPTPLHALNISNANFSQADLPLAFYQWTQRVDPAPSSQLYGLFKSRFYTADLTQILCTQEQVVKELISCLQFIDKIIKMFGFEHHWYLSTRSRIPSKYKNEWRANEECLAEALKACHFEYTVDPEGENPSYGPRIESGLIDALGRTWRGPHIAANAIVPEKASLRFLGNDQRLHKPMMITRSLFGSLECFIGILIEHYSGNLPLWLMPEQVRLIPIAKKGNAYAEQVKAQIEQAGFRISIEHSRNDLSAKVHSAEKERIPYIAIVGEKEEKKQTITVRSSKNRNNGESVPMDLFLEQLKEALTIEQKALNENLSAQRSSLSANDEELG